MTGDEYLTVKKILKKLDLINDWYAGDIRIKYLGNNTIEITATSDNEKLDNSHITWQELEDRRA